MASPIHEHSRASVPGRPNEAPYDPFQEQAKLELAKSASQNGISAMEDLKYIGESYSREVRRQQHSEEWSPRILKLVSLVVFVVFLLALISLAEVFIRRSPYPAPTSSSVTFVWTYLPTAVVVLVDWIWQSYDLEIKILLPWALLSSEAASRERPWVLDYRSMLYPTAMWHALRHKHFAVILTSAGFWVVAVANIMSTSLWSIDGLSRTQNVPLAITSSMPASPEILNASWENETYFDFFMVHHLFDVPLPRWIVNDSILLESFGPADTESAGLNSTLYAQTKAFSATLDCTETSISYTGNATTGTFILDVDAAGCGAQYSVVNENTWSPSYAENSTQTLYYGFVLQHMCPGVPNATTILSSASLVMNEAVFNSTSVACVPQYDVMNATVTVPPSSSAPLNATAPNDTRQPFSFSGGDTFLMSFNNNSAIMLKNVWDTALASNSKISYAAWFTLLQLVTNLPPEALLDQDVLVNTSQAAFSELWAIYARQSLFVEPTEGLANISGLAESVESVLQARPARVRVLQAMLAVLTINSILVYIFRPRAKLPVNPSSLVAMAVLLDMSDSNVHAALHGTGDMTEREFREDMKKWHFTTSTENGFAVRAVNTRRIPDSGKDDSDDLYARLKAPTSGKMWQPLVLHPISQLLLLSTLATTIGALEALYRLSQARSGFIAVPNGLASYWWSYAAPAYVSILGVFTMSYDFHARAMQPYVAMAERPQPVQKSLGYNPAAHTGLSLFWHSLRFQNVVGIMTSISLLIIPFVKIAVAGLLATSTEVVTSGATLIPTTTFSTTFNLTALVNEGVGVQAASGQAAEEWPLTQIPEYGLSLPAGTTSAVAIGGIDLSTLSLSAEQDVTINVPLPVFSASLVNCTLLQSNEYSIVGSDPDGYLPSIYIPAGVPNYNCSGFIGDLPDEPSYFGGLSGFAPSRPVDYCAGLYFIFYGYSTGPQYQNITNMTITTCENNMTISTRTVTMSLPGSDYSGQEIVSVDDANPTNVTVVDHIANISSYIDADSDGLVNPQLYITNVSQANSLDGFFEILILRYPSTPLWTFSNPDVLIPALQELWSSFWAFWADSNMRIPVDPSVHPVDALVDTPQSRVCQNWVATRVMQALLGAILLCDIISVILLRNSGRALPKAPYSIGSQMSLLVDSSILDLVSQQREEKGVLTVVTRALEAHRFSLGWSKDSLGNPRFGIEREDATS